MYEEQAVGYLLNWYHVMVMSAAEGTEDDGDFVTSEILSAKKFKEMYAHEN